MQAQGNGATKRLPTGFSERHARSCPSDDGGKCSCTPSIRAFVYERRTGKQVRKTFTGKGALSAAKAWRADLISKQNAGRRIGPTATTLRAAAEAWLAGAEANPPTVLTRGGAPYKPSITREYRRMLNSYVYDDLGSHRLSDIRRGDLQNLVDRLTGQGLSGGTVRNIVMPIRVIYRHAIERDEVAVNPTENLRLPGGSNPRERAASADEAADLLAALPESIRPIYAVAFYAGLRRGELRGLRWEDVDLAAGVIHVRRGWDPVAGEIAPKSKKGKRSVPVFAILRDYLDQLKATRTDRDGGYVFGSIHGAPFTPSNVSKRATKAWDDANKKRAKAEQPPLEPIGLHECRHTFVSMLADAGLPLEQIGDYVGHSSTYMVDRYRHLLKGHEDRTRRLLDDYFARANTADRLAQLATDD